MKILPVIAIAMLLTGYVQTAFAQDSTTTTIVGNRAISLGLGIPNTIDFHGHIGLAVGVFPEFEGSDDVAAAGLPTLDIRQEDFLFARGASVNPNEGYGAIGWNALNFSYSSSGQRQFTMSLGPIVRFAAGRDEDDNAALDGLGDIDSSVGAGGFIEARGENWFADVSAVPHDAGETGDGLLVSVRTGFNMKLNDQLIVSPGLFTSWGDDEYMQGYYGVNAGQSARSGLVSFNASSGFKDVGFQIGASYSVSKHFLVNGQIGYQRLLDDAADSPIIDRDEGSKDQFRALLGVGYQY